jgi:hypothetical protein
MTLTEQTIIATRQHFADIHSSCIEKARAGEFQVNDLGRYVEWQERSRVASLAGDYDHTFTFQQRAWWIQTGEGRCGVTQRLEEQRKRLIVIHQQEQAAKVREALAAWGRLRNTSK